MNRIDAKFAQLKESGQAALIPFVIAGDPDLETTLDILRALEAGGADAVELGVPFSDPMADGPTIQRASERALKSGASLPLILDLVREFRRTSELPVILFGYYNPFFRHGPRRLAGEARISGIDGILCVDLPPEESGELKLWTDSQGLNLVFLLSPTSDAGRIRQVAKQGRGFIYYVSVTGVTGARRSFDDHLRSDVTRVRRAASLPVGVGFGISTPRQAAWIASFADAVVVGSALVGLMEEESGKRAKVDQAARFIARLKRAIKKVVKKDGRR